MHCYNKGCGQRFNPEENKQGSCVYHPGPVYFHDAYKIWKCCEKKSTDFSTWLSYEGCTKGIHNGEKPQDEQIYKPQTQQQIRPEKEEEVIVWNGLNKPAERHATKREMVQLAIDVSESAKRTIANHSVNSNVRNSQSPMETERLLGTACGNSTCKAVFTGPEIDEQDCLHHPGNAVFHEGMKYWSCCERKTTDFGAFLDQEGCARGRHCWTKESVENIREDWFQRGGQVHITLYCKNAIAEETRIQTDGLALEVHLKHGFGVKTTTRHYDLFGEIVPEESKVLITERKVELLLKQKTTEGWPKLIYDPDN